MRKECRQPVQRENENQRNYAALCVGVGDRDRKLTAAELCGCVGQSGANDSGYHSQNVTINSTEKCGLFHDLERTKWVLNSERLFRFMNSEEKLHYEKANILYPPFKTQKLHLQYTGST
jgi:hypothetical protein